MRELLHGRQSIITAYGDLLMQSAKQTNCTTVRLYDPSWNPLLESPPHPEYPSGHGCYSGAAAEVLQFFFKTDSFHFFAKSDSLPHVKRSFSSFSACAQEIANSRLWGGIHFKFSNQKSTTIWFESSEIHLQKLFAHL